MYSLLDDFGWSGASPRMAPMRKAARCAARRLGFGPQAETMESRLLLSGYAVTDLGDFPKGLQTYVNPAVTLDSCP